MSRKILQYLKPFPPSPMKEVVWPWAEFRFADKEFLIIVRTMFWILNVTLVTYACAYIGAWVSLHINISIHPHMQVQHRKTGTLEGSRALPHPKPRRHPAADRHCCLHSRVEHVRHFMWLHIMPGKRMEAQGPGLSAQRWCFCHSRRRGQLLGSLSYATWTAHFSCVRSQHHPLSTSSSPSALPLKLAWSWKKYRQRE